jgi:hypothetical protein
MVRLPYHDNETSVAGRENPQDDHISLSKTKPVLLKNLMQSLLLLVVLPPVGTGLTIAQSTAYEGTPF